MSEVENKSLKTEIKQMIVECLNLPDVNPEDIDDSTPLFEQPDILTLDSLDALEIVMAIQNTYGLRIDNRNLARTVIQSVDTIAEFVKSEGGKDNAAS